MITMTLLSNNSNISIEKGIVAKSYYKQKKYKLGIPIFTNNKTMSSSHFPILLDDEINSSLSSDSCILISQLQINYNKTTQEAISARIEETSKCSESNKYFLYISPECSDDIKVFKLKISKTWQCSLSSCFKKGSFLISSIDETLIAFINDNPFTLYFNGTKISVRK